MILHQRFKISTVNLKGEVKIVDLKTTGKEKDNTLETCENDTKKKL